MVEDAKAMLDETDPVAAAERLERAEIVEQREPVRPDPLGGERVARELVAIHEEDVPAASGELDGEGRAAHRAPTMTAS